MLEGGSSVLKRNAFLIFNNIISELYRCRNYPDLGLYFLPMLKMLVPNRYASIMRREEKGNKIRMIDPLCVPAEFETAERNYMRFADDDYTGWLTHCRESTIFRESDLVGEQQRLRSTIYQKCYQEFDVYDSVQYAIVYSGRPLGVLSLFRCRGDLPFTDEELFLVSSVGTHLNQHMATILGRMDRGAAALGYDIPAVVARYGLTNREAQLLELLTRFWDNREIAEALNVRESTLQKHYQNIFQKFGVTSRWAIMRLLQEGDPRL